MVQVAMRLSHPLPLLSAGGTVRLRACGEGSTLAGGYPLVAVETPVLGHRGRVRLEVDYGREIPSLLGPDRMV
jgi:hypothetical protein